MAKKHSSSNVGFSEFIAISASFTNDTTQLIQQLFLNTTTLLNLQHKKWKVKVLTGNLCLEIFTFNIILYMCTM